MGIAANVIDHAGSIFERRLAIGNPFLGIAVVEQCLKHILVREVCRASIEVQRFTFEHSEEFAPELTGEYFHGEKEFSAGLNPASAG